MSVYSEDILRTPNLGSYWRMGELLGAAAQDIKGSNNATHVNSPTLGAAPLINGDPDAAVSYVAASSQETTFPGPAISTDGAVELWFKWTTGVALFRDHTTSGTSLLLYDNAGTFTVRAGSATDIVTSLATTAVADGKIHYIMLSKTGTAVTCWMDNVQIASGTGGNTANAMPYHVMKNGNNAQYSDGVADEIAIYTAGVPQATMTRHWQTGLSIVSYAPRPMPSAV